jgi:type IV secretory pathway component VirB8
MQHSEIFPTDTAKVRRDLESGEYFTNARQWYDTLYHNMLGERSLFIIITLFSAITIFLSLVVYSSMFPLNRGVPYVMRTDKISDDIITVSPLRQSPEESLGFAVSRFLVNNYVITREKYKYDVVDLERRFARIKATTSEEELVQYLAEVSPENPASPHNKYGRDWTRTVGLQTVTLDLQAKPNQAKVYFYTDLTKGPEKQTNQWLATIAFRFPPLTVDQATNKVLQWDEAQKAFTPIQNVAFEVVDYATQEVGSQPR